MHNIWLEFQELFGLGLAKRSLLRWIKEGKVSSRVHPDDSRKRQVLLSSLPENYRLKYYEQQQSVNTIAAENNRDKIQETKLYGSRAERKQQILILWNEFCDESTLKKPQVDYEFIKIWNRFHNDFKISRATLYNWQKMWAEKGLERLEGDYKNLYHKKAEFSEEAKAYIEDIYLDDVKRNIHSCYQNLLSVASEKGWIVPSYATVYRHIKNLPKSLVVLLRDGEKAFDDKVFPSILRDKNSICPGEAYVADDRMIDVSYGSGNRGQRLWVTAWLDLATKRIVGLSFPENPDTDAVLSAFYDACLEHIPSKVYLDNGSNYREASYTKKSKKKDSTSKLLSAPIERILGKENIRFAQVENAKTKLIERIFANQAKWFDKNLPGYTGSNILNRPDSWWENRVDGKFLSREEMIEKTKYFWLEVYNNFVGRDGKTPNERWEEWFATRPKRQGNPQMLQMALLRSSDKPYKVRRFGIEFQGRNYFEEWMMDLPEGTEVWVRYSSNIEKIWIYDLEEKPIGEVRLYKYRNVDYFKGAKMSSEHSSLKEEKVGELKAYKQRLQDLHNVDKTVERLIDRADVRKPSESLTASQNLTKKMELVDPNTGELFEFTVEELAAIKQATEQRKLKHKSKETAFEKLERSIETEQEVDSESAFARLEKKVAINQ